jgi:hypothetical protein
MVLLFIKNSKIQRNYLPSKIDGSYWFIDKDDNDIAINVEAQEGKWVIKNDESSTITEPIPLNENEFHSLKFKNDKTVFIYCAPDYDKTFKHYIVKDNTVINVGSADNNKISVKNKYIGLNSFKLT